MMWLVKSDMKCFNESMRRVRLFVYSLITIFIVDIAYANAAMMVVPHQQHMQALADAAPCHNMQMSMMTESGANITHDADNHHSYAESKAIADAPCDNCHDCLACFSMLPSAEPPFAPVYPLGATHHAFIVIYHAPHLIALQRPPISA